MIHDNNTLSEELLMRSLICPQWQKGDVNYLLVEFAVLCNG